MTDVVLHGTVVAIGAKGVLLLGPPGAGKSDLALRLIADGAMLVADDQTRIAREDCHLVAMPPATIAGLIEVRGLGIRRVAYRNRVRLVLVVELCPEVERMPEPAVMRIAGIDLPLIRLVPHEASAPAKLMMALDSTRIEASGNPPHLDPLPPNGRRGSNRDEPCVPSPPFRGEKDRMRWGGAGFEGGRRDLHPIALNSDEAAGTLYRESAMGEPDRSQSALNAVDRRTGARILLVTGMSGAGRSTALRFLEDMGYEAVDNLPLSLLPRLAGPGAGPIAVGIDIRTRDFAAETVADEFTRLAAEAGRAVDLVFLDCDDQVLARRYTETRRRHPLAGDRPVSDGIRLERARLAALRARAGLVIDTSDMRAADLKRLLSGHFARDKSPGLSVFVTSFSYRQGLPRDADLVFDVRFLKNPYYQPALRALTGLDPAVGDFVASDPAWTQFFDGLTRFLAPLLRQFSGEGKSYLTLAVGCTGGHHRSVFAAERLTHWLTQEGYPATAAHRDIAGPANPNDIGTAPPVPGEP